MKSFITKFAVAMAMALAVLLTAVPNAEAAPKYLATLSATDAGTSQTVCVSTQTTTIQLQSRDGTQYCLKTGTSTTQTANCTNDILMLQPQKTEDRYAWDGGPDQTITFPLWTTEPISLTTDKCIAVRAVDGGNPAVRVYTLVP